MQIKMFIISQLSFLCIEYSQHLGDNFILLEDSGLPHESGCPWLAVWGRVVLLVSPWGWDETLGNSRAFWGGKSGMSWDILTIAIGWLKFVRNEYRLGPALGHVNKWVLSRSLSRSITCSTISFQKVCGLAYGNLRLVMVFGGTWGWL